MSDKPESVGSRTICGSCKWGFTIDIAPGTVKLVGEGALEANLSDQGVTHSHCRHEFMPRPEGHQGAVQVGCVMQCQLFEARPAACERDQVAEGEAS